jgi:hypothetical protein
MSGRRYLMLGLRSKAAPVGDTITEGIELR